MKNKNTTVRSVFAGLLFAALAPLVIGTQQASAAVDTCTWAGGGADNNFGTTGNWNCSVDGAAAVPENGDTLVFDVSILSASETITNNMIGLSVASIVRSGDAGVTDQFTYTVDGNDMTLTGPIVGAGTGEYGQLRISIGFTLGSNVTMTNMSQVYLDPPASLDIGSNTLTLQGYANLNDVSGAGNIVVEAGYVNLTAQTAQNYTGDITVTNGTLNTSVNAINSANSVVVSGTGLLSLSAGEFSGVPITLGGSGGICFGPDDCSLAVSTGTVTLSGGVTLTSDIIVTTDGSVVIEEPFTDNGFKLTAGSGGSGSVSVPGEEEIVPEKKTTTIEASDKSSAAVNAFNNQTVIVNGERGSAYVYSGGVLKGTGTITGSVNVTEGGVLAPGLSPGCLASGNLSLAGTYQVEIAGTTVCSEYDQTDVTGTVDVTGATLETSLLNDFVPNIGNTFVVINNDDVDTVTGEFTGLTNGATFVVDGVTFRINYDGGDGNDVVLTVTSVPAVPDTGAELLIANPIVTAVAGFSVLGILLGSRKLQFSRK